METRHKSSQPREFVQVVTIDHHAFHLKITTTHRTTIERDKQRMRFRVPGDDGDHTAAVMDGPEREVHDVFHTVTLSTGKGGKVEEIKLDNAALIVLIESLSKACSKPQPAYY
jgi:hypothetical protein